MTVAEPHDVTRRSDDLVDMLGQIVQAYRAAHADLYDLAATSATEGFVHQPTPSDPVGARFGCEHDHDCSCLTTDQLSRKLRNASNMVDSARTALTSILFNHLAEWSHLARSKPNPDMGAQRRREGEPAEPAHLLLGAGLCQHGGAARCERCARQELADAHAAKAKREGAA